MLRVVPSLILGLDLLRLHHRFIPRKLLVKGRELFLLWLQHIDDHLPDIAHLSDHRLFLYFVIFLVPGIHFLYSLSNLQSSFNTLKIFSASIRLQTKLAANIPISIHKGNRRIHIIGEVGRDVSLGVLFLYDLSSYGI